MNMNTKVRRFFSITIFLAIAAMLFGHSANAISLRFKFKVFSSGPNIYACNAGIYAQTTSKRVCFFQGTNQTCNPDDCSTTQNNCQSSCVCSGDSGGGYLMNYGKLTHVDWKDNGDRSETNVTSVTFQNSTGGVWKQALTDSASWGKRIKDLSFHLSSELYSAKYFVDICYRGSKMELYRDGTLTNFRLVAQSNATDFLQISPNLGENDRTGLIIPGTVDGRKYTELSGLKVQSFVTCDFQGVGNYVKAADLNNLYNTSDNEAGFTLGSLGNPNGATEGSSSFWSSSPMGVSTSVADLIDTYIVSNSPQVPRFCKVRYVFTETDWNNAVPNLRKWQPHGAEMCTYTRIEEGLVSGDE